ncbi:diguanylate cyclase domain-containing protein, partial [Rhizobium leguminosarum]|uniref:diguanylate cyclase domain-containing protein n=1 Tax=Rhizobium leguminosarum TaxID=384 RepID=UPI003F9E002C
FKSVNYRFGHAAGDRLLNVFSGELSAHCRTGDTAARLGGEEFVLVLKEIMPGRAELTAVVVPIGRVPYWSKRARRLSRPVS